MVKQSIRDKEDSLRPMPVFKDLPANLLRRAVYDGFRVEHEYGRFKLVQVGPLGGRRTGSYIKYPDWLKARMNEGVPEHIVHPNGSVPPPDSKARVRR